MTLSLKGRRREQSVVPLLTALYVMVGVGAGSAGSAIHLPHHLAAVSVTTAPPGS